MNDFDTTNRLSSDLLSPQEPNLLSPSEPAVKKPGRPDSTLRTGGQKAGDSSRIGIYAASRLSARIPGLIFRAQKSGDTGLNAHLELTEEYPKTGKSVGLQVRSDDEPDVERTTRGYICRGEMSHAAYWFQHALPVIVMVYEKERDRLLWECVSADTIEISGQYWQLLVPYDQTYGQDSLERIADLPCYSPYLARLAIDRPWMTLLEEGRKLLIEMDEWLNQPSAVGNMRLSVLDDDGGRESIFEWPFRTNPDMPHVFRLPSLFPWAQIQTDAAFYQQMTGTTPEDGALTPWTVEAGEIARFQLSLSLNELGRSFLVTEQFLRRGDFPSQAASAFGRQYEDGIKFRLYSAARSR